LCFERRFSKQNSVIRLKSNILAPPKFFRPPTFLGWLRHWTEVSQLYGLRSTWNYGKKGVQVVDWLKEKHIPVLLTLRNDRPYLLIVRNEQVNKEFTERLVMLIRTEKRRIELHKMVVILLKFCDEFISMCVSLFQKFGVSELGS